MKRNTSHLRSSCSARLINEHKKHKSNDFSSNGVVKVVKLDKDGDDDDDDFSDMKKIKRSSSSSDFANNSDSIDGLFCNAYFMKLRLGDVSGVVRDHPIPCVFAACMLFFMFVEYALPMVPSSSPPYDLGFAATKHLHALLASTPTLNSILAGLNTVFVGMQTMYILWTWLIEGRPRATISALFMFTFRGILGYSTQLPLPEGFLGSGIDFPVGNVSFFLFYSGHVAASVIASLDMRRMRRWEFAYTFDVLNVLQVVRLLATRGHYTIDLAAGVGAGILFDSLSGIYEDRKRRETPITNGTPHGAFNTYKE